MVILLGEIFSMGTAASLARTCRHFYNILNPVIYRRSRTRAREPTPTLSDHGMRFPDAEAPSPHHFTSRFLYGYRPVFDYLVDNGANAHAPSRDCCPRSVDLVMAATWPATTKMPWYPLHTALYHGDEYAAEKLVRRGAHVAALDFLGTQSSSRHRHSSHSAASTRPV